MAEGTTEMAFLEVLLEKSLLRFKREELLMEKIFHSRQIDGEIMGYIQLLPNGDDVSIFRVGDTLTDALRIPKSILPSKIRNREDISTTPEFEILFIIHEGLHEAFLKVKSHQKPSSFYKGVNKTYNKQASFVRDYFTSMGRKEIVGLVRKYVHLHGRSLPKGKESLLEIMAT